ncbi:MAG: GreA/GreB family elongation factor [Bdellovibrionaceae bacterium]|nr:GreA/GreB family elongation factor [Pseudobdellovibrionaceae bacterium]
MDKKALVTALIASLEQELEALIRAARATYEAATHEESKPENEYDTFALESSYLAGAQSKRAGEIDEVLSMFKTAEFKTFSKTDVISATALVQVESKGKKSLVLIMPKGGGVNLNFEGQMVQVITPHSSLGEALLGLKVGDTADIEINEQMREYRILSVA